VETHIEAHIEKKPNNMSSDFQSHLKRHAEEKPFNCSMCHESFHRSSDLKIHLKVHTGYDDLKTYTRSKSFKCL
jgi:KRAB domain-containing zinc finger protein